MQKKNALAKLLVIFCFILATACSKDLNNSTESTLCKIYSEVNENSGLDISMREGELSKSVKNRMPEFYSEHFVNIMLVDWDARADTLDRVLSMQDASRPAGLCEPIITYYSKH